MVVRHMADAVYDRIAEMDVGRGHVDLGPEAPFAVGILAVAHRVEYLKVAFRGRIARRRRGSRTLRNAAIRLPLVLREVAAVGLAPPYELLRNREHRIEHVGGVVEARLARVSLARPLKAEPLDVALDVLGVFVGFLRGIRVVEPKMALAAKKLRHPEINADGLCVPDVYVAVRLRRKARHDLAAGPPLGDVLLYPLPEKMP